MLITERFDPWGDLKVFSDLLPEDTISLSVKDAHLPHIDHYGIIYKAGDYLYSLIQPLAADVDIGIEIEPPLRDGRAAVDTLSLGRLEMIFVLVPGDGLYLICCHLGDDLSYSHTDILARHLHYLTHQV